MLNWICPDCGRECAPTSRDCPSCVPVGVIQAAVTTVESEPPVMRVESPKNGHHNGNGAHEPPQPTPETLQAMVDHLEEQIALAPAPVSMNVCADGPPVAAPEAEPELDEISALAFISAQQLHAEELLDL